MKRHSLQDRLYAHAFTRMANLYVALGQMDSTTEHWYRTDLFPDELDLYEMQGDPNWKSKNPLNRNFRLIGVLAARTEEIEKKARLNKGSQRAMVMHVGNVIVVRALGEDQDYLRDPELPALRFETAGIGAQDLSAELALWVPDDMRRIPLASSHFFGYYDRSKLPDHLQRSSEAS